MHILSLANCANDICRSIYVVPDQPILFLFWYSFVVAAHIIYLWRCRLLVDMYSNLINWYVPTIDLNDCFNHPNLMQSVSHENIEKLVDV